MKNKHPKIAVYSGEIPSTIFIERLIKGLSEESCEIFLFGYLKKKITYKNSSIKVVSYSDSKVSKFYNLIKYTLLLTFFKFKEKKQLDTIISKKSKNKLLTKIKYYPVLYHQPDIFHLQWAKSIADWSWVQQFGIKLIVSLRGAHINYSPIADNTLAETYRRFFPQVDGFHAVSKAIAQEAQKYGAHPDTIKVVYSGLKPIPAFDKKEKNKIFQILSVGRAHWVKGYDYALQAMKILLDKKTAFVYTVIGGKDSEEMEFLKADLGLQDRVQLLSNIPFEVVQQKMFQADVLLLPSVEEGIANVVLEAMQLGTLVLTTDCGGMQEVIKDGKNGYIVPVRDPQRMAEALEKIKLLSDSQKEAIRLEAQKTIAEIHSQEKMVTDMLTLYEKVL